MRYAESTVEPDGRHLGHGEAQAAGLGHELEPDFEALVAVDADFLTKPRL